MLIFNVAFNNDFHCIFFIFFRLYFFHNIVSAEIIFLYYTSSNHRLGSAGLNAFEELLFRCWQEDGNACLVLKA